MTELRLDGEEYWKLRARLAELAAVELEARRAIDGATARRDACLTAIANDYGVIVPPGVQLQMVDATTTIAFDPPPGADAGAEG